MRRLRWIVLVVLLIGVFGLVVLGSQVERLLNRVAAVPLPAVSEESQRLHRSHPVVDLHADPLLWGRDLTVRSAIGHTDFPRLREGGVAVQVFGIVTKVPRTLNIERNSADVLDLITPIALTHGWPLETLGSLEARALYQARRFREMAALPRPEVVLIRTREHVDWVLEHRNGERDVLGAILAIEGAHALEERQENLQALFDAGVRMIGLAHFFDNAFAGSAHGEAKGGLTEEGRKLVRSMEERGVILDLAHASPEAFAEALEITTRPPVVSHTGVRGTCDNRRNLSDDQIRAVAASDGVIGIGLWETAICGLAPADVVRAMQYVVDLVGDDHVALGTDFDGAVETGFDATALPAITQEMVQAGFGEESIGKILGGNALRVFRETLPPGDQGIERAATRGES